jgi:hypothetical protein
MNADCTVEYCVTCYYLFNSSQIERRRDTNRDKRATIFDANCSVFPYNKSKFAPVPFLRLHLNHYSSRVGENILKVKILKDT